MINRQFVFSILLATIAAIVVLFQVPPPAFAAMAPSGGNQSNQATPLPATLTAPDTKTKIALYGVPITGKRIGYGQMGDSVTVTEQITDNDRQVWDHVTFAQGKLADAWVRGEFVALKALRDRQSPQQGKFTPTKQTIGQPQRQGGQSQPQRYSQLGQPQYAPQH